MSLLIAILSNALFIWCSMDANKELNSSIQLTLNSQDTIMWLKLTTSLFSTLKSSQIRTIHMGAGITMAILHLSELLTMLQKMEF
mgnify:CR=1 FL=1